MPISEIVLQARVRRHAELRHPSVTSIISGPSLDHAHERTPLRTLKTAVLIGLIACQSASRSGSVPSGGATTGATVEVWLTTGDQRALLTRQPDLMLVHGAQGVASPVIVVDPSKKCQEMIGFGGAMTDASAFLIQNRMSATERERLMQDLFGRDSGVGFSFVRVPMGASDFSARHYSYDDMPAPESDSSLAHFSIDADRVEIGRASCRERCE